MQDFLKLRSLLARFATLDSLKMLKKKKHKYLVYKMTLKHNDWKLFEEVS